MPIDGTSLQITDEKKRKGIGPIGALNKGARGVLVMTALAVGDDGAPIGICAQRFWTRQARSRRTSSGAVEEGGESLRWLEVLDESRESFASEVAAEPWYQIDRGGDCWQVLTYAKREALLLTVRAAHDRRLDRNAQRLWDVLEAAPRKAVKYIEVPARPERGRKKRIGRRRLWEKIPASAARRAKVAIRATAVTLKIMTSDGPVPARFNAVLVQERTPRKDRVEWLLLTTHEIRTRRNVLEVVRGYSLRWRVEEFHRTWKRGLCRVEETQLRSRDAIYKWATILAAVATRAMRLTRQARTTPDAPATDELSPIELEALIALRQPRDLGDRIPSLAEATRWIAELGGYTGPWNGPPGVTVIGRGLHDVVVAARAFAGRPKK